jgi:BASS family bile acid:Na+ symporter
MTMGALLPAGLALIMFSLGLGLRFDDFRRLLQWPVLVAAGLLAQVVLLPLSAYLVARVLQLDAGNAIGLMILAACPGGVTAGMATRLAGGDTALSISLTALTSLLAFVTVPLIVGAAMVHFGAEQASVRLPVAQLIGGLFVVTLVPVCTGLLLREGGGLGDVARRLMHRLATAVFVLIVVATFVDQWAVLVANLGQVGLAAVALNLITMATGIALGAALHAPAPVRTALALECGLQNAALGITLAVSMLGMAHLAVPSIVYALLMNVTMLLYIAWRRRCTAVVVT